jgi:hypothetical protein
MSTLDLAESLMYGSVVGIRPYFAVPNMATSKLSTSFSTKHLISLIKVLEVTMPQEAATQTLTSELVSPF